MSYRPQPKYVSKDARQGAWATCDRCGFIDNLPRLQWQFQFMGGSVPMKTGFLYCVRCLDELNYQGQLLIIPPDPPPLMNARPEPYTVDETSWLSTGVDNDGDIITSGSDPFITSQPNPADNANTAVIVLTATLSTALTALTVAYLDLFNGDPTEDGTSILQIITGSATRSNVFDDLEQNGQRQMVNPDVITVTAAAENITNVTHVAIYTAASGGSIITSGPVGATYPTIVQDTAVQFNALGLNIQLNS